MGDPLRCIPILYLQYFRVLHSAKGSPYVFMPPLLILIDPRSLSLTLPSAEIGLVFRQFTTQLAAVEQPDSA